MMTMDKKLKILNCFLILELIAVFVLTGFFIYKMINPDGPILYSGTIQSFGYLPPRQYSYTGIITTGKVTIPVPMTGVHPEQWYAIIKQKDGDEVTCLLTETNYNIYKKGQSIRCSGS